MLDEATTVTIVNDQSNSKWDAYYGDDLAGVIVYEMNGPRLSLTHAAVRPEFQGRGVGTRMIADVLNEIRSQGRTATILCGVVRDFIDKFPEYSDVVDAHDPGLPSSASRAKYTLAEL